MICRAVELGRVDRVRHRGHHIRAPVGEGIEIAFTGPDRLRTVIFRPLAAQDLTGGKDTVAIAQPGDRIGRGLPLSVQDAVTGEFVGALVLIAGAAAVVGGVPACEGEAVPLEGIVVQGGVLFVGAALRLRGPAAALGSEGDHRRADIRIRIRRQQIELGELEDAATHAGEGQAEVAVFVAVMQRLVYRHIVRRRKTLVVLHCVEDDPLAVRAGLALQGPVLGIAVRPSAGVFAGDDGVGTGNDIVVGGELHGPAVPGSDVTEVPHRIIAVVQQLVIGLIRKAAIAPRFQGRVLVIGFPCHPLGIEGQRAFHRVFGAGGVEVAGAVGGGVPAGKVRPGKTAVLRRGQGDLVLDAHAGVGVFVPGAAIAGQEDQQAPGVFIGQQGQLGKLDGRAAYGIRQDDAVIDIVVLSRVRDGIVAGDAVCRRKGRRFVAALGQGDPGVALADLALQDPACGIAAGMFGDVNAGGHAKGHRTDGVRRLELQTAARSGLKPADPPLCAGITVDQAFVIVVV